MRRSSASQSGFAAQRSLPEGWTRTPLDDWLILAPAGCVLPPQGWKIHVSACLDNAGSVLDRVLSYCVPRGLSFVAELPKTASGKIQRFRLRTG